MALFQTAPEEGGQKAHVHWSFTGTAPGAKNNWHGYIAGPCNWFTCHSRNKKSKPCLHAITHGALKCDMCSPFHLPQTLGYQPLYRQLDGKPVVVIFHDYSREQVDALGFHTRVLVGRGEGGNDPVWMCRALTREPIFRSTLANRNKPADITVSLLTMWKIPELTEWANKTGLVTEHKPDRVMRSSNQDEDPPREKKVMLPMGELADIMDHNAEQARERASQHERNAAWLRANEGSKNGHAKKK